MSARGIVAGWLSGLLLALASQADEPAARPRGEPGSRLGSAGASTEYWDLLAQLDSGHRVFARFSITNEGPGEQTAYALGHVVDPKGNAFRFQNGRKEGHWTLHDGGHHLEIGSSELFLRGPERRLFIEKPKKGVVLDLRFTPPPLGRPQDPGLRGYFVDLLHAATPVQGTLQLTQEMSAPIAVRGTIACAHTWMEASEPELSVRRIDFYSLPPDPAAPAIYLSAISTPSGAHAQRVFVERSGEVLVDEAGSELALGPPAGFALRPGYGIPSSLEVRAPGLSGRIRLSRPLLEDDPMGVIPQPFRWLMSLQSRPHRVWIESPFEVRVPGARQASQQSLRGVGVTALNFLNPL